MPSSRPTTRRRSRQRTMRRAGVLAAFVAVTVTPSWAGADHGDAAAERAAREIQDARDRANAAAQALFDAESRIDVLDGEIAQAEEELAAMDVELGDMQATLEAAAVRRFTQSGGSDNLLLTPLSDIHAQQAANVYVSSASGLGLTSVDDFEAAIEEYEDARDELERQREEAKQAEIEFGELLERATTEVARLQEIEQLRLEDEAVQHELQRLREAQLAKEAEQARIAAAEQQRADAEAAAAQATAQATGNGGGGSSNGGGAPAPAPAPRAPSQPAPQPPPPPPPPPSPPPPSRPGMACPVVGSYSYADTWGAPRSGGRRHQGVDMIASTGTPLVAVESGSAHFKTNRLGGNAVWLTVGDGTKYYYAHLDSWEGSSRSVSQGEVIGYVGDTGNATGVPHLHFEVHPGGGPAVNPYPYVRQVC